MTIDEIIEALERLGPADAPGFDEPLVHQHQAVLYDGMPEFLAGTVPHLREGIEAGAPTLAIAPAREAEALREALGPDAPAVQFINPLDVYTNPVRAMTAISAVARTLGPRPAWVVATDDWERYPDPIEWVRYEAMLNVSFPHQPYHSRCCYDTRVLPPEVVEHVRRTHPEVFEGEALRDSPVYGDQTALLAELDRRPLPASPHATASMRILPADLHAVRAFVAEQARGCGVTGDALHQLLVAVTEVATNAIRHGDAPVTLRAWPDNGLICEITDSGDWQPDAHLGWTPPDSVTDSGFGLWGAGMLCDTVQVRPGAKGTTVRLRTCA
ncbi:anti-sigma factor RsbA family regulatory protein [Streptomyces sp. BH105]|uniref:anti-sigma factor RsbA family regulatory protein n=1 Tax=Streptomyces sp. BH105 TaxID=3410408 RepID=UPI003CF65A63